MVLAEPVKAYYLLAPRAWEILTGSIVWRISCFWSPSTKHINFFSLIGIALLLLAICGYDNTTPFPGIAALFPCIGTAILLYLGAADKNKGVVFGVLRAPPLVFLGRISYPIYLWHWPVIAFSTYYLDRQFLPLEIFWVVVVTIVLASATHYIVEIPLRVFSSRYSAKIILAFGILLWVAALIFLTPLLLMRPFKDRLPSEALPYSAAHDDWSEDQASCVDQIDKKIADGSICSFGNTGGSRSKVLLWGDSHATALLPVLSKIAATENYRLYIATTNGCPPVVGLKTEAPGCLESNSAVMELIKREQFDAVVMSANWNSYGFENWISINRSLLLVHLESTLKSVRENNSRIILVGQVPRYSVDVPNHLQKVVFFRWFDEFLGYKRPTLQPIAHNGYISELKDSADWSDFFVDPADVLCSDGFCSIQFDQRSLYKDGSHLSHSGSSILRPILRRALRAISKD